MPTQKKGTGKKAAPKKAAKKATPKKAAKKTVAKKSTAKKATAKKAATKKTTAKKTIAKQPMAKATKPAAKATKPAAKATKPAAKAAPKKTAPASTLAVGEKAPAFSLQSTTGDTISLNDFAGRNHVVLYFYPKDDTPGCTIEACSFRDRIREMEDLGAVVLGVSPDDVASHAKFTDKYSLNFPLLADPGATLAKKFDVWREKNLYGKKSMGIERSTFLIDKDGNLAQVWRRVKVDGHDDEVIDALRELEPADTWNR
jgi:thioredoxin-dependent peroxiredoxin